MMNQDNNKKAKRIAAIVYLLVMTGILTGTYFSEQQKAADKMTHVEQK